jgi:zinc protease
MEERRLRTDDQPQALLFEQLTATAFQAHPYRVPIIGWMNDLENHDRADARIWYDNWYAPNNAMWWSSATSIIRRCSRLPSSTTVRLPARPLPVRKPQDEPPQLGIRRLTVKAPADLPVLMMAYKVPVIRDVDQDVDPYALEMLAAVLAGHDAARFSTSLVREAASGRRGGGRATTRPHAGPGIFYLRGSPSEGKSRQPNSRPDCAPKSPAVQQTGCGRRMNLRAPRRS